MRALVRGVSGAIADCELTWLERDPIDLGLAREQHAAYVAALRAAGVGLIELPADDGCPDCCFVEDIVLDLGDGLRILTAPGAQARRAERAPVAEAMEALGPLLRMPDALGLDGGDVLQAGGRIFVGRSSRTRDDAIAWLAWVAPREVVPVELDGVLHLKSGLTALDDQTLLYVGAGIDMATFEGFDVVVHHEPNVVCLPDRLLAFPSAAPLLRERGYRVDAVDSSELVKAEAALTCMSVLLSE